MTLLLANWKYVGMGVLAALLAFQSWRLDNAQDALREEQIAHASDIKFWKAAGVLAATRAKQSKARIEGAQDKVTTDANDDYRRRAAAFDSRVRFTPSIDQRGAGSADLPNLSYAPTVFDGPGATTVISKDDARLCGILGLRLLDARDWALKQSSIDRGE